MPFRRWPETQAQVVNSNSTSSGKETPNAKPAARSGYVFFPGYEDNGDYWRSWYETEGFEEYVADLWETVLPLYEQLHAYVYRRLEEVYSGQEFSCFPVSNAAVLPLQT